jgi:hypothetical protein
MIVLRGSARGLERVTVERDRQQPVGAVLTRWLSGPGSRRRTSRPCVNQPTFVMPA